MAKKFKAPSTHYLLIETDLNANDVGFTWYAWVKHDPSFTGITEELFNAYGSGPNPFIGWNTDEDFVASFGGSGEIAFSANPPVNEWFFMAVTVKAGTDGFKARWYDQEGALGGFLFLDNNFEGDVATIQLMGFNGNGQGVPGKLGKLAFVPQVLTQLEQELAQRDEPPPVPPVVEIPTDSLENTGGTDTEAYIEVSGTSPEDIEIDGDAPDLELLPEIETEPEPEPLAANGTRQDWAEFQATHLPQGLIYPA